MEQPVLKYKPCELLKHYKGGTYIVLHACRIEATGEWCYAYRGQDGSIWVRPVAEIEDPNRFEKLIKPTE